MGYLPKHIKVQRYKRNLLTIAHAVLAGAVIVRRHEMLAGRVRPIYMLGLETAYFHTSRAALARRYLQESGYRDGKNTN